MNQQYHLRGLTECKRDNVDLISVRKVNGRVSGGCCRVGTLSRVVWTSSGDLEEHCLLKLSEGGPAVVLHPKVKQ